jgi:peptide/nickel transport system substrate-binding protein
LQVVALRGKQPDTIRFTLVHPEAAFLYKLAFSAFAPCVPDNIVKYDGGGDLLHTPVCTGPLCFVEWLPDDHITLQCNEDYWAEKPQLETLTHHVVEEAPSRLLELRAAAVEGVDNLSPDDILAAEADPDLTADMKTGGLTFSGNYGNMLLARRHQDILAAGFWWAIWRRTNPVL